MNISNQLFKVDILLTDDGFVSILKHLPMAFVTQVKCHGVTGQQAPHQTWNTGGTATKQKVGVIRHERPRITFRFRFWQQNRQAFDQVVAVPIIDEDVSALYPANNDVMQDSWSVYTS